MTGTTHAPATGTQCNNASPMQALLDTIATLDYPTDAARVFHGRGGLHPGCEHLCLDVFPPVWLLTSFTPLEDDALASIAAALERHWATLATDGQPLNWVYQCRAAGHTTTRLMLGSVPEPHVVSERGTRYLVRLLQGQNHGLFLDMAEGRTWVAQQAASTPRLRVLNLFAYTCAFSVVALQHGARQVINMDMSTGAMATGQKNHQLNGVASGARFLVHDIFNSWGKITRMGPYDLIIVDPPSYQKGSFVASKDYARLLRRLPDLLDADGRALLCLNAPELGAEFLQEQVRTHAPQLRFVQRLANPAAFADVSEERALKALVYSI